MTHLFGIASWRPTTAARGLQSVRTRMRTPRKSPWRWLAWSICRSSRESCGTRREHLLGKWQATRMTNDMLVELIIRALPDMTVDELVELETAVNAELQDRTYEDYDDYEEWLEEEGGSDDDKD